MSSGRIRVGVGGWSFAPWRETFYPSGVSAKQELAFASRQFSAIEINATFYRTQTPELFRRWAADTPSEFAFSVKAHRLTTHRNQLAEAGSAIDHFLASGLVQLGDKLGPIVWQFAPTKKFEADDFEAFLQLLPKKAEGRPLRHVLEVRHESFSCAAFVVLARRYGCAICFADSPAYPVIADITADFTYARLQRSAADLAAGYAPKEISKWADRARLWAGGKQPDDLPYTSADAPLSRAARDVFIFFIAGAKEKNPAAASALLKCLES